MKFSPNAARFHGRKFFSARLTQLGLAVPLIVKRAASPIAKQEPGTRALGAIHASGKVNTNLPQNERTITDNQTGGGVSDSYWETPTQAASDGRRDQIILTGIEKSYGSLRVVGPIDLEVRQSEFLTLLGPSGSGKTTTLMMIAGLQLPSSGTIEIDGQDLTKVPPYRRNLGVMFQDYALFPHMTVGQNIAFPLKQRRLAKSAIAEQVREVADMVELGALLDRRIQDLSGGQRQRVALARTLVFKPKIVLMDEPLGALDRRLREQMQIEIKRIHDRLKTTFVVVTHDQDEALTMSDRVAVFNKGIIEQIGPVEELYSNPATAFVANFLGDNNNLVARCVETRNSHSCRVALTDDTVLETMAVGNICVGDDVTLTVRPESATLSKMPSQAVNQVRGELTDVIFHGDHWRVIVRLKNGASISVKVSDGGMIASLPPGSDVFVGIPPSKCRVFRAENEGDSNV
ncbi:ABC transporter ATP-binding protein [Bradyrhizobium sp. BRP14]|nr:ABC transporter ATP-binding protein [Bradyrhizobium sp. BRP14]